MRPNSPARYMEIAADRGGRCIKVPRTVREKGRWRCAHGHEWEALGQNIIKGSWCPYCAGVYPHVADDYHRAAARHGGICLVAPDSTTHYGKWQCANGHIWNALGSSILRTKAHWCRECAINNRTKS